MSTEKSIDAAPAVVVPPAEQMKLLLINFIKLSVLLTLGLGLLRWLMGIQFQLIKYDDWTWEVVYPIVISLFSVFFWLRRGLRKLNPGYTRYLALLVAVLTIAGVLHFSQYYLVRKTGRLTVVHKVGELDKLAPTRYYKLLDAFVLHDFYGMHTTASGISKNAAADWKLFAVMPLKNDSITRRTATYWVGIVLQKDIRTDELGNDLYWLKQKVYPAMSALNVHNVQYFENSASLPDAESYASAVRSTEFMNEYSKAVVMEPRMTAFEDRTGNSLLLLFVVFACGTLLFGLLLLIFKKKIS